MQGLDHRAAHQARNDRHLRQRKCEDRQDLVDERTVAPAADRQQMPGKAEDQLDDRRNDEGRDRAEPAVAVAITA